MKEPRGLIGQTGLTSREMREVVMQTAEPFSTMESTYRLVKIFDSTYANSDLEQVSANATQINAEDRTQILSLLQYLEYLSDGNLGDWCTYPVIFLLSAACY